MTSKKIFMGIMLIGIIANSAITAASGPIQVARSIFQKNFSQPLSSIASEKLSSTSTNTGFRWWGLMSVSAAGLGSYFALRREDQSKDMHQLLIDQSRFLLRLYERRMQNAAPATYTMRDWHYGIQVALSLFLIYSTIRQMIDENFKVYQPGEITENFSNVGGNEEAKKSLQEIVEYLKNPDSYSAIGAKPTTGILLTGEPGTGKTLLARALAGEANCAFIYASGADIDGKYVGSGVGRIKALFSQARAQYRLGKKAPCIIFMDEVDAFAVRRGAHFSSYTDQTLNQLLTELDGFEKNHDAPIIFIAATNCPEKLDPAFLRPGRIDRIIHIGNPDCQDRVAILKAHISKIQHDDEIDLDSIAKQTVGLSGAQLQGIVNSAARIAHSRKALMVSQQDLQEAYEQLVLGTPSTRELAPEEKEIIAYHESGHALISMLLLPKNTVHKITIVPRGSALGVTHTVPNSELPVICTKEDYLNQIAMLLGGRAAEELIFKLTTTGPSNDLMRATELAEAMLQRYGMGDTLPVKTMSDSFDLVQSDIAKILDTQYQRVLKLLKTHKASLRLLAKKLLEKGTLCEHEIKQLRLV